MSDLHECPRCGNKTDLPNDVTMLGPVATACHISDVAQLLLDMAQTTRSPVGVTFNDTPLWAQGNQTETVEYVIARWEIARVAVQKRNGPGG